MKKNMKLFFIALAILLSEQSLLAQSEIQVEEILVSAEKSPGKPQNEIQKTEIQLLAPRDIGDIFKTVPGFGVIKRGGYAMEPVFRSFKYEQINMMFDGSMRIFPACPNRMDPITTHVNPEEISKIEIIKGPYSVRYGQTLGGIVNVVTDKESFKDGFEVHGMLLGGYQTNGEGKTSALQLHTGNKNFDIHLSGGLKDFGNYKSGWGAEIPSSFKSYDYALKLGVNPSNNQRIVLGFRQSFGRDITHVALPMDTDTDDSKMLSFDYSLRNVNDLISEFNVKAYYSDVDHVMSNKERPNFSAVDAVAKVFSKSYGVKIEAGALLTEKSTIYAGIDYNVVLKDGERTRLVSINMCNGMHFDPPREFIDLIWQDSKSTNFGFFVESENRLSDHLIINGGLRVDMDEAEIKSPADDFNGLYNNDLSRGGEVNYSGNISLKIKPEGGYSYIFAVGRGVRAPKLTERYINHFNVGADAYEYVGNPDLKPEKNYQVDFSVLKDGDVLSFNANIFASYLNDFISAYVDTTISRKFMPCQPPQYAKRFVNVDEAFQYGFEFSASYHIIKKLWLEGNVFYTRAQNIDFDEPLEEIPPLSSMVSLIYKTEKLYAALNARFVAEQNDISILSDETSSSAFNTLDLKLGYKIHKMLEIDFGINNVFDANYYEHLSRPFKNVGQSGMLYEPGRNFIFTARVKF
jgi:iron complex outermembrane recepter protein